MKKWDFRSAVGQNVISAAIITLHACSYCIAWHQQVKDRAASCRFAEQMRSTPKLQTARSWKPWEQERGCTRCVASNALLRHACSAVIPRNLDRAAECMHPPSRDTSISGLVVEYIVAIDVTRVRFPADASFLWHVQDKCSTTFKQLPHCLAYRIVVRG